VTRPVRFFVDEQDAARGGSRSHSSIIARGHR
jgi:hypothetical protein